MTKKKYNELLERGQETFQNRLGDKMRMNPGNGLLFVILLAFSIALAPVNAVAADANKEAVITVVRALGYGGAIHNFKNYVLRGKDKYRVKADSQFVKAEEALKALKAGGADSAAVDAIAKVVGAYRAALPRVQKLVGEGKLGMDIDKFIKISDRPAVNGLSQLWKEHNWGGLEKVEYALGYGQAIHQFKNLVLRGRAKYAKKSIKFFSQAEGEVVALGKSGASVAGLLKVIGAYKAAIEEAQKMVAAGKSPGVEIDSLIKVDDGPAVSDLKVLRG